MSPLPEFASRSPNRLELLGHISLEGPGGHDVSAVLHQSKRLALLAWLSLHQREGFVRRDQILGLLWPNHNTERARAALRQGVHFLRQHLGAEAIVGRGDEEVGIDPGVLWCDVIAFEDALERKALDRALALYRGDLMPGFFVSEAPEFERWLDATRQRLRSHAVAAAWTLSQAVPIEDDASVTWARHAVALEPTDESGVQRLMTLLAARGDRAGAVAGYDALARHLRDDLDLTPSAGTQALLADIRSPHPPAEGTRTPGRGSREPSPAVARTGVPPPDSGATRGQRWTAPRRWLVAGGGAALVVAAAVALSRRPPPPVAVPLDADLVAVAPFEVLDDALALWKEGMASILSANLDGAGPLRTTPPSRAVRHWRGPTDRASLGSFGRRLGAALVLGGRVLRVGADSIRVWGTLVDARTDGALFETQLDGHEAQLTALADSLTVRVLRDLGRDRPIGAVRRTSIGSSSMPALRAFLRGEHFYRNSQWDSALVYHRRAVEGDSAFAPALRRVSDSYAWIGTVYDDSARQYRLRAGRFNHGLAPRESLLIQAESLYASLEGSPWDGAWWRRRQRLFGTLEAAQRGYPDDPEVWNLTGESAFHHGEHPTTSFERSLAAFDRAIALDSAFTPAYVHAMTLAGRLGDVPRARGYATRIARAGPGVTTFAARAFLAATDASPDRDALDSMVNSAQAGELFEMWAALTEVGDSAEVALRVVRRLAAGRWRERPYADPGFRDHFLLKTLLVRGHVREAARLARGSPENEVELAMFGALAPSDADARFDAWLASGDASALVALPWWSGRRDTVRIRRYLARLSDRSPDGPNARTGAPNARTGAPNARTGAPNARMVARAFLLLARGDSAAALRALDALPDSACAACGFVRLARAQLLLASRDPASAARFLAAELLWIPQESPLGAILWDLYRGVAFERVGDTESAARAYARVVSLWRHADPELATFVQQAREGLGRGRSDDPPRRR